MSKRIETRRDFLKMTLGGTLAAAVLTRCGGVVLDTAAATDTSTGTATGTGAGTADCVLDPSLTKGPYWVDERLNRSDVRADSNGRASPNPRPGLPLALEIAVASYSGGACTPLAGAQVDIWHCDATGQYSDVGATAGQNFLRGYQVTGADGIARFQTIYPGWYAGRTVHIHVKVRLFDAFQNTTSEATTQIFFDDSITDSVFASVAPYSSRGARDTRNSRDSIYGNQTVLLTNLSGDVVSGFTGTINLGVQVGQINPN